MANITDIYAKMERGDGKALTHRFDIRFKDSANRGFSNP